MAAPIVLKSGEILPDISLVKEWTQDISKLPSITWRDVQSYLLDTPSKFTNEKLKNYKSLNAYTYFTEGHVGDCYFYDINNTEFCYIKTQVLPSQRQGLKCELYNAWVCLHENGWVLTGSCSCVAGLGEACSHTAALLFKLEAAVHFKQDTRFQLGEQMIWLYVALPEDTLNEPTACTSKLCAWKSCRKNVEPSARANIVFKRRKRAVGVDEPLLPDISDKNVTYDKQFSSLSSTMPIPTEYMKALNDTDPNSAVFTSTSVDCEPYKSGSETDSGDEDDVSILPEPLLSLYDPTSINLDHDSLLVHSKDLFGDYRHSDVAYKHLTDITIKQDQSTIWHIHRGGRVTSSNVGQVMSTNQDTPCTSLINNVMQYTKPFSNIHTKYGKKHEPIARTEYLREIKASHTNISVKKTGFWVKTDMPFLGASPDGIVECDCHEVKLLEIKCPSKYSKGLSNWESDSTFPIAANGEIKTSHAFYAQVQLQMHVCNISLCDLFIYSPAGPNITVTVQIDDTFVQKMVKKSQIIFENTILPEIVSRKKDPLEENERQKYCYCDKRSFGNMIGCDGPQCKKGWFHYPCVGITRNPRGRWYCRDCKASRRK